MADSVSKRELVLGLLDANAKHERVPAAFFQHFGGGYHSGPAAVQKHIEFFRFTDMDFVKIQMELDFPQLTFERPKDWAKIPFLGKEFFAPMVDVVASLVKEMKSEAVVVLTLYSPFMCAGNIGGPDVLTKHMREDPDAIRPAIETMTASLLGFVRDCVGVGLDGFYQSTQGREVSRFANKSIFENTIKPYDLEVMKEIERHCPFSILHICDYHAEYGGYDDLTPFLDYPGQVVNCNPNIGGKTLSATEISKIFGRPFMGGMDRNGVLATGSEDAVRSAARAALADRSERFILGADCTIPGDSPWGNLRVAVSEAHRVS